MTVKLLSKRCFFTAACIYTAIATITFLIWTHGTLTFDFSFWQNNEPITHEMTECSISARYRTYDDILTLFYTPNHTCSSIGVGPLVHTNSELSQRDYASSFTTSGNVRWKRNVHQPGEGNPCQRHTIFRHGTHLHQLHSSQDVHEFIKYCNKHAPKRISLKSITKKCKTSMDKTLPVPNIVHYIWFSSGEEFTFLNYLSFLSVHKYIEPDFIYIHGDKEPSGGLWTLTLRDVANIYFVYKQRPLYIFGKKIKWIQHSADITRYEIIYDYGGIYLDTDVLVLKSFDPLRQFNLTLGRESSVALANGIIVGARGTPFFRVWMETYRTFVSSEWGQHSVVMADTVQKLFPALVHVEEGTLVSPTFPNRTQLFQLGYDWSSNYAVHVWKRHGYVPEDQQGIKQLKNTLGEVMRYIYFGSSDVFSI